MKAHGICTQVTAGAPWRRNIRFVLDGGAGTVMFYDVPEKQAEGYKPGERYLVTIEREEERQS